MSVEKGGSAATAGAGSLNKSELAMAKRLGISPKEYAKNK
jgi:phage I-like protein